jgi:tryptophanyl-tRNA synthetase
MKFMSALTDSRNAISYDPVDRPGVSNLLDILSAFDAEGRSPTDLATSLESQSLKSLKEMASESVIRQLGGIRRRFLEFLHADGGGYLDSVEVVGAKKARASAEETMQIVREAIGL